MNETLVFIICDIFAYRAHYESKSLEGCWEILHALVFLDDSLRPARLERLLGTEKFVGAIQTLRDRRVSAADFVYKCISQLVFPLDVDAGLKTWFLQHPMQWQWIVDWLYKEEHQAVRQKLLALGVVVAAPVGGGAGAGGSYAQHLTGGGMYAQAQVWPPQSLRTGGDDSATMDVSDDADDDMYGNIPLPSRKGGATYDADDDDEFNEVYASSRFHK